MHYAGAYVSILAHLYKGRVIGEGTLAAAAEI